MPSQVSSLKREVQFALFLLHCLDDDALKVYNGFSSTKPESERTVSDIIARFQSLAVDEVNETYERFLLNNLFQKDRETFEAFYSELRRLANSCNYCDKCLDSILLDQIALGVRDKDIQRDSLKLRNLTVAKAIDVCKAAENADRHKQTLNMTPQCADAVNRIPKPKCHSQSSNHLSPPHFLLSRPAANIVVGDIRCWRASALLTAKNAASVMAAITLPACSKQ